MSSDQLRRTEDGLDRCLDLDLLLAAAQVDEPGLHAFYLATAPRLALALSATEDARLAEEVLIRTYRHVWRRPTAELAALTGDRDVFGWLMRIALVELASLRRTSMVPTRRRPVAPGLLQ